MTVATRVLSALSQERSTLPTGRAVLLALAIKADEALSSPQGYTATYAHEVAYAAGVSEATALGYLRKSPLAVKHSVGWRVVESLVAS